MKLSKSDLRKIINEAIRNYYSDIDVNNGQPTGDKSLIKKAYRKSAMKHHPDRGGDAEKMKIVTSAYGVLSDEQKKRQYDQQLYRQTQNDKQNNPGDNFSMQTGIKLDDMSMQNFARIAGIEDKPSPSTQDRGFSQQRKEPRNPMEEFEMEMEMKMEELRRQMEEERYFQKKQRELISALDKLATAEINKNNFKSADRFMEYMKFVYRATSYSQIKEMYEAFVQKG